jgi:RimJ/RimL family protein N-acetyltransferase
MNFEFDFPDCTGRDKKFWWLAGTPIAGICEKFFHSSTGSILLLVKIFSGNRMGFCITTERLILEDLSGQDLTGIRHIAHDPGVMKYVLIWLENDEQIAGFLQHAIDESLRADRRDYVLAVRVPGSGSFAGFVMLEMDRNQMSTAEIGCVLLPEYWNNAYVSEILRALLAFGFEKLSLHHLYGKCDELNLASAHVMEKCGLAYEGTIREHVWLRDHWLSTRYYGMLEGDYSPTPEDLPCTGRSRFRKG